MLNFRNKRRDSANYNKLLKQITPEIDKYHQAFQSMSETELLQVSARLKDEVGQADINSRYQAFALVKEAVFRSMGMIIFDVQLLGGWMLCEGHIAEMKTGEGKTVTSLLPAFWFALQGKGVHMITVNSYLARRDYEHMTAAFKLLGVSVGLNLPEYTLAEKKRAFQLDVTFGTSSEFGFDYLRDHLAYDAEARVLRELAYAIVDEVDSILIDEARTPLLIAGKTKAAPDLYWICARFVDGLKEQRDYELDLQTKQVMFTPHAVSRIEATFQIDNLYDLEHSSVYHYLLQSLRAQVLFHRDVDYIVEADKVIIIDAFTGRMMEGRQYGDGLHQAIEAKEQVPLSEEIRTQAAITIQKYFSLYDQVVGMTGTAKTAEAEFKRIYGLDVKVIPTYKPLVRMDYKDIIFPNKDAKYTAIVEEIKQRISRGQPILVGTTAVQQSEEIASRLTENGITYRLLNAKKEQEEADIIACAGQQGAVTIATNMAGRGTDIRLGDGVAALGGLHVIGTERHESRRVDDQLRGRAGRQGDPGSSQFLISLEDTLLTRFAADELEEYQDQAFASKWLDITDQAQRRVESQMYDIRTLVNQMDSIIHEQRQAFYVQRDAIVLYQSDTMDVLSDYMDYAIDQHVNVYCPENKIFEEWDIAGLASSLRMTVEERLHLKNVTENREMLAKIHFWWNACCDDFITWKDQGLEQWISQWRAHLLQIMDRMWQEHLDRVDGIKQGIHYQAYAQRDPILAYEQETWNRFNEMGHRIQQKISEKLIHEVADWKQNNYEKLRHIG